MLPYPCLARLRRQKCALTHVNCAFFPCARTRQGQAEQSQGHAESLLFLQDNNHLLAMFRTCPYCKQIISFRCVLFPGPFRDERIRCNRCDRIISGYWKDFSLFFPFLASIFIMFCIPLLQFSWATNIVIAILIYLLVMLVAYWTVPLKQYEHDPWE